MVLLLHNLQFLLRVVYLASLTLRVTSIVSLHLRDFLNLVSLLISTGTCSSLKIFNRLYRILY